MVIIYKAYLAVFLVHTKYSSPLMGLGRGTGDQRDTFDVAFSLLTGVRWIRADLVEKQLGDASAMFWMSPRIPGDSREDRDPIDPTLEWEALRGTVGSMDFLFADPGVLGPLPPVSLFLRVGVCPPKELLLWAPRLGVELPGEVDPAAATGALIAGALNPDAPGTTGCTAFMGPAGRSAPGRTSLEVAAPAPRLGFSLSSLVRELLMAGLLMELSS